MEITHDGFICKLCDKHCDSDYDLWKHTDMQHHAVIHIMEPHWNDDVRVKQVISRAIRLHTHSPIEERKVEVFNYSTLCNSKKNIKKE